MSYKRLSLLSKIILLGKVLLAKWRILKLVWVAKTFPLNDFARERLEQVEWDSFGGTKFKKIPDTTGEYRFFVPSLSNDVVWRIDSTYSTSKECRLPVILRLIAERDGTRNEEMYKRVWEYENE